MLQINALEISPPSTNISVEFIDYIVFDLHQALLAKKSIESKGAKKSQRLEWAPRYIPESRYIFRAF